MTDQEIECWAEEVLEYERTRKLFYDKRLRDADLTASDEDRVDDETFDRIWASRVRIKRMK